MNVPFVLADAEALPFSNENFDTIVSSLTRCHRNREPLKLAWEAGLKVVATQRVFLGIFHEIQAKPRST